MALLPLLLALAGGTLATYWTDERHAPPLIVRLAAGAVLGVTVLGLVGLVLALAFGLGPLALVGASAVAAAPLLSLVRRERRVRLSQDLRSIHAPARGRPVAALVVALMALGLVVVFEGALYTTPDGIYTSDHHNLGDLPFHIGITHGFVYGDNLPPEHPELSGARLTYPFLVDFAAALLIRAGASLRAAFLAENVLLALALLALLIHWGTRLTRDARAGLLIPPLVLLSGGLGFWRYFADAYKSEHGLIPLLAHLPHDYTISGSGAGGSPLGVLRWGNALTTLLIPQRAFLLGLALGLIVWTLLFEGLSSEAPDRRARQLTAAGVVLGLVPLAHTHTFMVMMALAVCLALLFPDRRAWVRFFVVVGILALPQLVWLFAGSSMSASSFVGWQLGWARDGENPLWFWIHNTGLVLPALAAALLWRRGAPLVPRDLGRFLLPWVGCFVAPNLLRLSPWIWDNIKFLFYAFVAATPILALLLVRIARWHRPWGRLAAAGLLVVLTLAGTLDTVRVTSRTYAQRIFGAREIAFARLLRRATPPQALILHAPTYNHPVLLAGRRSLLGYTGHIYSQGLDPGTREQDIAGVYGGRPDALARLRTWGVGYVVVGPPERSLGVKPDLVRRLPLVGEVDGYRLYRVPGS